ncbi:GTP-binding protein gtr2 [Mycoemilia scoparia]|uniref:GTP-binding protein n=1 Tax=Mycoemilia scoparia TaxID=417184 RepID=A0A9W8DU30_9FUNG|nr:GTP-binding protein gtr2 [Mycoemilia scoparia]
MLREPTPSQIFVLGLPKSGKTSILSVLFNRVNATDTLYLETTTDITEYEMYAGIKAYDYPSQSELDGGVGRPDPRLYYNSRACIIYVIDSQDDVRHSVDILTEIMETAYRVNTDIRVNVFIHKVDGLSRELQTDIHKEIEHRIIKFVDTEGYNTSMVSFFLTSIYDHTVNEAISKVSQEVLPHRPYLDTILNTLCSRSMLDKVYLFDTMTKTYISTDFLPNDTQTFKFCFDSIVVLEDMLSMWKTLQDSFGDDNGDDDDEESEKYRPEKRSVINLKGTMTIITYQVNRRLTLFCIGRPETMQDSTFIEYNAGKAAKGIRKVIKMDMNTSPYTDATLNSGHINEILREDIMSIVTDSYPPQNDMMDHY